MGCGPFSRVQEVGAALETASPFAPWSIQSFSKASWSGFRFWAFDLLFAGGITGSSRWAAVVKRKESAPLPGTIAGPESPPLSMSCGDSRLSPALGLLSLWQARQLALRKG